MTLALRAGSAAVSNSNIMVIGPAPDLKQVAMAALVWNNGDENFPPTVSQIVPLLPPPMPPAVTLSVVTDSGRYYLLGQKQLYRWDQNFVSAAVFGACVGAAGTIGRWIALAQLNVPRKSGMAMCHNPTNDRYLFVFGGEAISSTDSSPVEVSDTEMYDIAADRWIRVTPAPSARRFHRAVIGKGGKIWLLGGCRGNEYLDIVEEFDPVTRCW